MIEQSSRTFAGIFAVLLLLATPALTGYHPAFAASSPTGVMIPLYSYPGSYWNQVVQAKNAHPSVPIIAIINPDNGPGSSSDSNYVSGIQQLQSAGVTVLGYVDTTFASKSTSSAESEINSYNNWYHVNGIFFDDMQNTAGYQNYYSTLSSYVKSHGSTMTVGNPGTSVLPSYIGTMDNLCIFENNYEPTVSTLQSFTMGDDKSNFSYIAYEVGLPSQSFLNSVTPYVSYIYATDDGSDGNPYDAVPSYLGSMVAELDTGSSSTTAPSSPAGLTASAVSTSQINLSWTVPSNNGGSAITGYKIDRSTNSGSTWSTIVSNSASTSTTYSNTGLAASTAYTYRVSAINSVGTSSPSSTASATTLSSTNPPPSAISLTVKSVDLSGAGFSGMWVELHDSNGNTLATGYTPVTFNVTSGTQYTVYAADYQSTIFNHWNNGSTNSSISVTPTRNTTLTASYTTSGSISGSTPVTLTVKSVDLSGAGFTGMWVTVATGGNTMATGYTTFHYSAQSGTTYKVTAANYQNYVFSHWSNGSTNPTITVTPTKNTTLVAYYNT